MKQFIIAIIFFFTGLSGIQAQQTLSLPSDIDSLAFVKYFHSKNVDLTKATTLPLYIEVFRWINTKYKFGGKSESGIDCSGFAGMLYGKIFNNKLSGGSRDIFPKCDAVDNKEDFKEGDLLFFKIWKGMISHVAVYLGDGKFAHATVQSGVTVDSLDEPYYKKYFYKAGKLKDFILPSRESTPAQ